MYSNCMNVTDLMSMNRMSSVAKSVLRYVLDKGQYFDLETSFTQSSFPYEEIDIELNRCSHSELVFETNTHCYCSINYWRNW